MKTVNIILISLLITLCLYAGSVEPENPATPNQPVEITIAEPKPNVYYEIVKWTAGTGTLVLITWFGWWLNDKRKKK